MQMDNFSVKGAVGDFMECMECSWRFHVGCRWIILV